MAYIYLLNLIDGLSFTRLTYTHFVYLKSLKLETSYQAIS